MDIGTTTEGVSMARSKTRVIGTEELAGATVVSVDWNEITFDLNGRKLHLELEYEVDYHSMCEGNCCYSSPAAYFVAREIVE